MKIWIDVGNSPHVNFFCQMTKELRLDHTILLTSRPLANTIQLLDLLQLSHHIIGKHYGKNLVKKIFGFCIRNWQLYHFLRTKGVDVAVSHSSFYSPLVSKLIGSRCIYLNDNEHASGNRISFIFADRIMIPEYLEEEKVYKQWATPQKIIKYPGVKEGIYLWDYHPDISGKFQIDNPDKKKVIFIRPEPWTAQYYKGKKNFLDDFLISIKDRCKILLLPRSKTQKSYYQQQKFSGVFVPITSISLNDIMDNCDLFIGAGGTMTREAAVLGIPTISIYQDKLLDVDNYLIQKGHMIHKIELDDEFVVNFLKEMAKKPPDRELLEKGKSAYYLIKKTILENNSL